MTLLRRRASTAADLKALAHPVRLDLLELLLARGPLTATQAGTLLGQSPANVSWHLRTLATAGYVRPMTRGPGRQRPWKAVIESFDPDELLPSVASPSVEVAVERDAQLLSRAARLAPDALVREQLSLALSDDETRSLAGEIRAVLAAYAHRTESSPVAGSARRERAVVVWIAPVNDQ